MKDLDPTKLARPIDVTEASLAWAIDESPEVVTYRPPWITRAAVAAALVLIAGAGGLAAWHYQPTPRGIPSSAPLVAAESVSSFHALPEPSTEPSPAWGLPIEAAAAKPTEVIGDPGPRVKIESGVDMATLDRMFVANLQTAGWNVWNPADVVPHAHTVCAALLNGDTVPSVNQQMVSVGLLYPREALSFTAIAMATYPDCP